MMDQVLTVVLAGATGPELGPLTNHRGKCAVPFGGQYRLIDFALSNCLHSGLRRILVLPQYKSQSLMKHLRDGWSIFNPSLGEYITPVPPQMRTHDGWYAGTADAVGQNLYLLERSGASTVIVLTGDHVYRMDYAEMVHSHVFSEADVTICCRPLDGSEPADCRIVSVDEDLRVTAISNNSGEDTSKPQPSAQLLAAMGIFVFPTALLVEALRQDHADQDSTHDFESDVLPKLVRSHDVAAYRFGTEKGRVTPDGYWRAVDSVDAYFNANMDLLQPVPPIDLYQTDWQIRTANPQSPPARTCIGPCGTEPRVINSIISRGSIVSGGTVINSILSPDVRVDLGAQISDSVLFAGVTVGAGAEVRHCIIEKGVNIPPGMVVNSDSALDTAGCMISKAGIVVIPMSLQADRNT